MPLHTNIQPTHSVHASYPSKPKALIQLTLLKALESSEKQEPFMTLNEQLKMSDDESDKDPLSNTPVHTSHPSRLKGPGTIKKSCSLHTTINIYPATPTIHIFILRRIYIFTPRNISKITIFKTFTPKRGNGGLKGTSNYYFQKAIIAFNKIYYFLFMVFFSTLLCLLYPSFDACFCMLLCLHFACFYSFCTRLMFSSCLLLCFECFRFNSYIYSFIIYINIIIVTSKKGSIIYSYLIRFIRSSYINIIKN